VVQTRFYIHRGAQNERHAYIIPFKASYMWWLAHLFAHPKFRQRWPAHIL